MSPSANQLQCLVNKLGRSVLLDTEDAKALLALPHQVRGFTKHQYVVRERDRATTCGVMLTGFAIRHKIVADGARQIVAIQMAGDVVDLQNSILGVADHSVQMLTSGDVAIIPREALQQLAFDRPRVALAMWRDTLVDGSISREWIANVGRRDSVTRLAHVLCEFALRLEVAGLGEQSSYELPMTQEELGDVLGLTSVHVNRTLKELEARGLIKRTTRDVVINDWDELAVVGDFDATYLHLSDGPRTPARAT